MQNSHHATMRSYIVGFGLSLVITVMAYIVVVHHVFSGVGLIVAIMGLAVAQLLVQLIFFLHLGRESNPRWNLIVFLFMLLVLVIIVAGSLWIMDNLNYNMMMTPEQMDEYMIKQSNKGF